MTDTPLPHRPRRVQGPVTTGDIVILTIVIVVLVAVVILGGAVALHELNLNWLSSGGWSAAGALVSGAGTVFAVLVALRQSRDARQDARMARRTAARLQRQEAWRSDIAATLALLEPLEAFRTAMRKADLQADTYRMAYDDPQAQISIEDKDGAFLNLHSRAIGSYTATVTTEYLRVRSAAIQITTPDLRPFLDEACKVISLLGKQIDAWSLDARKGAELRDVSTGISELGLKMDADTGVLGVLARRVLALVRDAAASSKGVDIWSDEDGATVDQ